jgi:hypothetical protein
MRPYGVYCCLATAVRDDTCADPDYSFVLVEAGAGELVTSCSAAHCNHKFLCSTT